MLITIKNLQQQTFTVDCPAENTVLELKQKIFHDRGTEYTIEKQKLIYAGVILDDERTISSYNIDEKKFLVVMLKRDLGPSTSTPARGTDTADKKTTIESTESPSSSNKDDATKKDTNVSTTSSVVDKTGEEQSATSDSSPNSGSADLISTAPPTSQAESNLLTGEDYSGSIDSIVEMGYSREMVERAMAASFNNPERAVEYLINGIPEMEVPIDPAANLRLQSEQLRNPDPAEPHSGDPFEFLRNQPQFLQMRSLVSENPDLLHAVLQQIGQTNPALLQLISENQDAFLGMLNEPMEERSSDTQPPRAATQSSLQTAAQNPTETSNAGSNSATVESILRESVGGGLNIGGGEQPRQNAPTDENILQNQAGGVTTTLRLTRQDQDAIERLKALGFPETLVLQAYFACEKDEQLAANFLISSGFDD